MRTFGLNTRRWYVSLMVAFLPILVGVLSLRFPLLEQWLTNWIDAVGVYVSFVLTGALVLLYFKQQEILKQDQEAKVSVREIHSDMNSSVPVFNILLKNVGSGGASDLFLEVSPSLLSEPEKPEHIDETFWNEFIEGPMMSSEKRPLFRSISGSDQVPLYQNYLLPEEEHFFQTAAAISLKSPTFEDDVPQGYIWKSVVEILHSMNIDKLRMVLTLNHSGPHKEVETQILDYVVPINPDLNFSEALEEGNSFTHNSTFPDSGKWGGEYQ